MPDVISRTAARSQKLKHYYTGLHCCRGHLSPRYVSSGGCVECQKTLKRGNAGHWDASWNEARQTMRPLPRNVKSDFSYLTPEQCDEWYERVSQIRNGARFIYGSKNRQENHKPLDELQIIWQPKPVRMQEEWIV
jgi:hypothetical protein